MTIYALGMEKECWSTENVIAFSTKTEDGVRDLVETTSLLFTFTAV